MVLRARVVSSLVPVYLATIIGVATVTALAPVLSAPTMVWRLATLALAPVLFVLVYVLVAGGLSRLTLRAMVTGNFPRDLGHPVYGPRRLHALCWTAIYYCTPLYHAVLAIPLLKRMTFRLFGYRGSLNFTLHPDSWIRDLPLLQIQDGAYVSNRATIGTNMCSRRGHVLVAPVHIGRHAMIGHLAMLAPGVVVEDEAEIGVGCAIGLNARVGANTRIAPCTSVNHGVSIGAGCEIGAQCLIGMKAVIHDNISIPAGTVVPPRTVIRTTTDVQAVASCIGMRTHAGTIPALESHVGAACFARSARSRR